jgi:hypothetical protein
LASVSVSRAPQGRRRQACRPRPRLRGRPRPPEARRRPRSPGCGSRHRRWPGRHSGRPGRCPGRKRCLPMRRRWRRRRVERQHRHAKHSGDQRRSERQGRKRKPRLAWILSCCQADSSGSRRPNRPRGRFLASRSHPATDSLPCAGHEYAWCGGRLRMPGGHCSSTCTRMQPRRGVLFARAREEPSPECARLRSCAEQRCDVLDTELPGPVHGNRQEPTVAKLHPVVPARPHRASAGVSELRRYVPASSPVHKRTS